MLSLPSKVVAEYWYASTTGNITDLHANVNMVYYSFAKGTDSTSGSLHLQNAPSTLKSDIATLASKGIPVVLSIGGINDLGSTHGYNLKTSTQVSEAVTSLKSIISTYGFSGIDLDLEDPFNFTVSAVVDVINQLCAAFPGLIVTLAAMYFDSQSTSGMYRQVATALGNNLTAYGVQFYDHSGWTTTSWVTDVTSTVGKLVSAYGDSRVIIGFMRPDDNGLNVPVSLYVSTWNSLVAKYPNLRGGFRWTSGDDKSSSWEFAATAGNAIRSGYVAPAPTGPSGPSGATGATGTTTTTGATGTTTTTTGSTTVPSTTKKVTIGSASHSINGINIYRNTDYLVIFTPAKGASTGTNQYGCEVTVVGGKVTKVVDKVGNSPIPSNGYVLSGHGTSRTWLLNYAKVGTLPVLS